MSSAGAFTFVLHSHLPYARQAGMWPHGEEWVHEGIAETYLPLLNALHDLAEEDVPFKVTIGITPILAEQLSDPLIVEHFLIYAQERAAWAASDIDRFETTGQAELKDLAVFYHHWYARALSTFQDRFQKDILAGFRVLQDRGFVEIATCAATHGYLPLLARDSSIFGQIQTGIDSYVSHFGRRPKAIWLPECAYRPAYFDGDSDDAVRRPGIESFLAAQGIRVFFSETHTVEGGRPVGKAAGEAIGPYGEVTRRYAVDMTAEEQAEPGTTYKAYWVGEAPGKVAVLGRNNRTGQQVWSGSFGYPGDAWYREFHRKDGVSGMQYWRIGGPDVDLGQKPPYDANRAAERVRDHARHYVGLVEELLVEYHVNSESYGIIASNYDTELFGHWWFEGVEWLKEVLRGLALSERVDMTTASQFVAQHEPERVMSLPEGSWGSGGTHFTWMNIDTQWMWPPIHAAEERMEKLVERFPSATGEKRDILNQATRELLLLESSDWPFLVTTGQAKEYASQRFSEHLERFQLLADMAEGDDLSGEDRSLLATLVEADNPFRAIDYRAFAERQGSAELN